MRWRALAVVLVHGLLHQPQPEHVPVEGERALHVRHEQRDVVKPGDAHPALVHRKPRPPGAALEELAHGVERTREDGDAEHDQHPDLHGPEPERDDGDGDERRRRPRAGTSASGSPPCARGARARRRRARRSRGRPRCIRSPPRAAAPRPRGSGRCPRRITSSDSGKLPHGGAGRSSATARAAACGAGARRAPRRALTLARAPRRAPRASTHRACGCAFPFRWLTGSRS